MPRQSTTDLEFRSPAILNKRKGSITIKHWHNQSNMKAKLLAKIEESIAEKIGDAALAVHNALGLDRRMGL